MIEDDEDNNEDEYLNIRKNYIMTIENDILLID
jgi:hypothetical protein